MGLRRGIVLIAVAGLFVSGAASAAAPVKPKNGLYQGVTAQYEPVGFKVRGREEIVNVYLDVRAGTCDTQIAFTSDPAPITNRGRFSDSRDFSGTEYAIRGRFFEKTKARGRVVFTADDPGECGVSRFKTRFRVERTPNV